MREPDQIPSGTVTLLFTDVEGSTRLWDDEPDEMAQALRQHDDILRTAIEQASGYVFKTVGDAFCAAFWTAPAALGAALTAQRELDAQHWPTSRPVRVRMGLHSGVCEERDNDYFGPVVNRAARLMAIAYGGQILVSGATAELAAEDLPDGVSLRDLGLHRLKDLGRPEQVFQVEAGFLQASFPPLGSLDNPELPNNLPILASAFIGRDRELAEIRALARSSRLVTLTGSGGSGKTRLALQAAAELLEAAADGVWLADLAPVTSGEQIPCVVSAVLGLGDQNEATAGAAVIDALTGQEALLLLDNCEHVIDAAAKFCDLMVRHCPQVRVIATSREPLGIDGERVYRVPSLSLPTADAQSPADLSDSDAVQLFAERARAHDSAFALSDSAAPLVATICRRLDGIPLALELAAARLSAMSLQHVCERLDQRFRLLTGGSRNAMPRQQTLQATVDWSFSLLTTAERETLTRLSVFGGGFELEAAEAICSTDIVDALDVMDLLGSLVDKSLVVADRRAEAVRYRLLETIRQYSAQELLHSAGDAEVLRIRDRHAEYYLRLAELAAPALTGYGQGDWLKRLDLEWDNLRAALAHLEAGGQDAEILRIGVSLDRFSNSRLHFELIGYMQRAIDRHAGGPDRLLCHALVAVSGTLRLLLRKDVSQVAASEQLAERGYAMSLELGDRLLEARALTVMADVAFRARDLGKVRDLAERGVEIARDLKDVQLQGEMLVLLAIGAQDPADGRRIRLQALECCRQSGDELWAANTLHQLGGMDLREGHVDAAAARIEEALAKAERLGAELFQYFLRCDLAIVRLIQGRHADAAPLVRQSLLVARRVGVRIDASEPLLAAACCAAWAGDLEVAARLHGAAGADIEVALRIGTITLTDAERGMWEREQAELRSAMGGACYDAAYRAGAELSPAQGVELALSRAARSLSPDRAGS